MRAAAGWTNCAKGLASQGDWAGAAEAFRHALRLDPEVPEVHFNLGLTLIRMGQFSEAIAALERAVRLAPGRAEFQTNLGCAFGETGQDERAIASFRAAARLRPDLAMTHCNLGVAMFHAGEPDEAIHCFERAIALQADFAQARWHLGMSLLGRGDFERGWEEYEWRWRAPRFGSPRRDFKQPQWDGAPLAGRTVLLHTEQGLGDTLQFVRYASLVKARGGNVVVECQPRLVPLLSNCLGIDRMLARGESIPEFHVHSPLLSLPRVFRTNLANVPCAVPYVHASPKLIAYWRDRLTGIPGFRVGICWQGDTRFKQDRHRSIPLRHFEVLARVPGVKLFSVQKYSGSEQLKDAPFPVVDLGPELDEVTGPFLDTAAVMRNLDLIVTSDTATAHLAGALGVRVWMAVSTITDWRWLTVREDSPWYPTMRLFRQSVRGDWPEVFSRMAATLRSLTAELTQGHFGGAEVSTS